MKTDNRLLDLIGSFTRPILVMPGYSDMNMPKNISEQISIERLILAANDKLASETETMWYLSTVSLCFPLDNTWYRIYMYLFRRWCDKTKKSISDFAREIIILEEYEESKLIQLRSWLYKKGTEYINSYNW